MQIPLDLIWILKSRFAYENGANIKSTLFVVSRAKRRQKAPQQKNNYSLMVGN